ncbi:alpha/beta hydrolase [Herbidospora mongoliensis]|uniref:alpha/beta hydrolase n=1 Tax=Herbidospora mongoliensis TaxID=688067 RepID=UPI0008349FBA|nr:dienelactone hydrolase family protein [Herbidospora mongoliensis]
MRAWGLILVLLLAVSACGQEATPAAQEPAPVVSSAAPEASPPPKLVGCKIGPSVAFTPVQVQHLAVGIAGDGPVGVVIANTLDGYHCDWLVWADHLIKSGVRVAVFEYGFPPRMAGISAMLDRGPEEMMAVAAELRKQGAQKIVYAGGSLGGSVALATAAKPEAEAAGVVSLSGGLDGQAETVKTLTIPAIYAVAEEDTSGGAPALAKELHKATEDSELLVYPGAQHAGGMFIDDRYADELLAKLDAFLAKV